MEPIQYRLLLELNRSACFLKLLLGFFGFVFGSAFLNGRRSGVNHLLRFFQTQAGQLTNRFDDVYFLLTSAGQNNVKLGLLFSTSSVTTGSNRSSGYSGSSRNV